MIALGLRGEASRVEDGMEETGMEIGTEENMAAMEREKVRKESRGRRETFTTRHQTAERSAAIGTLSMRGAGSTAAGCINARYAWGATQCTHAHKESRKALRKTLRGVERMSDRQWSRGMPQPRHEPNKEAMR